MRSTGVTCDRCGTFTICEKDNVLPDGWITVQVVSSGDVKIGRFELCGNKCLRDLGAARHKADLEDRRAKKDRSSSS